MFGIQNLTQSCRFGLIWSHVLDIILFFLKFGIQNRENTFILNIIFGIDDLVPNFGPTIEVLRDFMKFGTKNKWNILIDNHCLDWTNFILKFKYALLLLIRLEIEIAVKSERTVRKLENYYLIPLIKFCDFTRDRSLVYSNWHYFSNTFILKCRLICV